MKLRRKQNEKGAVVFIDEDIDDRIRRRNRRSFLAYCEREHKDPRTALIKKYWAYRASWCGGLEIDDEPISWRQWAEAVGVEVEPEPKPEDVPEVEARIYDACGCLKILRVPNEPKMRTLRLPVQRAVATFPESAQEEVFGCLLKEGRLFLLHHITHDRVGLPVFIFVEFGFEPPPEAQK